MIRTRRKKNIVLDIFLLALIFSAAGYLGYRVSVQLHYSWRWSSIWQYLFRFDHEQHRFVANYLVLGLLTTLRLSLYACFPALLIGLVMALFRTSRSLFWQLIGRTYIELMRNLPPLVIIFLVYFFLADQITPLLGIDSFTDDISPKAGYWLTILVAPPASFSPFLSAVLTLAVFQGAYIAEILRAGIESVHRGQWEAAHALGLTRGQSMKHIILPQTFRQVLPPLAGQFISLIKDSSIVSVISIQELTYQGTQLMASTYMTIEVWILVALMYFALTFPCSMFIGAIERSFARASA
jgi:polar amino acid transport system permease protein